MLRWKCNEEVRYRFILGVLEADDDVFILLEGSKVDYYVVNFSISSKWNV